MFSKSNPFDELVASATDENLTSENWELILGVCDKVTRSPPDSAKDCIAAVQKRFLSRNANVQLYALTLSEALVKNCDITVHREISSRAFTNALNKLIHDKTVHDRVRKRALEFIQMCSFEFRSESSLGLMNEVYHSLRAEGIQFPSPQKPKKEFTQSELDKQKEEEEFQLALALSLSESESPSYRASKSAVKATNKNSDSATVTKIPELKEQKPKPEGEIAPKISRVRALYDFQPTEQGELGFHKGDIIRVIESVYRDWWKGELQGKLGIFPVNYVEKIVDPCPADLMKEAEMEAEVMNEIHNVERLLDMLAKIDPLKDSFSENEELQKLYNNTLTIRPKLVRLIEKYSLKKDELVALNEKFLQARTMYDRMLGNSIAKYTSPTAASAFPPSQHYGGYDPQGPTSAPTEMYQPYQAANQSYPQQPSSGYPTSQTPSLVNHTPTQPQRLQQPSYTYAEPTQQTQPALQSATGQPVSQAAGYSDANTLGNQYQTASYPPEFAYPSYTGQEQQQQAYTPNFNMAAHASPSQAGYAQLNQAYSTGNPQAYPSQNY
ncbi:ESCRT-0 subunit protein hse1 [Apophysomyces ossiformis]|uniref:Class E vacuolar protein-sorting machinery protein HSE1 n=1 Tax=Apophysomyces ossiformis TaxID=679940 RepID=A0A8H7ELI0_9FUNG|nr:ESCRT-0 subunit protein hse1 [Apophysomyces ossiformis]